MNIQPMPALPPRGTPATATIRGAAPVIAPQLAETTGYTNNQGIKTVIDPQNLVAFGKANLEAFVAAGKIWAAGVQDLTKQVATTTKASFEESVATFNALTSVKSVNEAVELQSNFGKTMVTKAFNESNKLTDASIKLTGDAMAPITARMAAAVQGLGKAA